VERPLVERVLAHVLREGTSRFARTIPKEGIESVTLSLAVAFWLTAAGFVAKAGLVVLIVSPVGYLFLFLTAILYLAALSRLISCWRRRGRYRSQLSRS
jgi:hypothetical protein